MLCNIILKEIFRYIHKDYHYIICKNSINDNQCNDWTNESNRKLSISIIINAKLHLQDSFSFILLSNYKLVLRQLVLNNHYDILSWLLYEQKYNVWQEPIMLDIIMNACNEGNLSLLVNLSKIGMPILRDSKYSYGAAENGHSNILQYLYDNGCLFNSTTFVYAAIGNSKEAFEFAKASNLDKELYFNTSAVATAACFGHLDLVQYLRENKCPWDSLCCSLSAYNRHYDVTVYCVKNGCRWNVFDS